MKKLRVHYKSAWYKQDSLNQNTTLTVLKLKSSRLYLIFTDYLIIWESHFLELSSEQLLPLLFHHESETLTDFYELSVSVCVSVRQRYLNPAPLLS